ncbi:MAG: MinD/ParA family ATP-binding protein, partial [Selenomonadaceae bacterium]
ASTACCKRSTNAGLATKSPWKGHEPMNAWIRNFILLALMLDTSLELVACVPYDTNLRAAVRKQKLIVEAFPKSPAALAFRALANKAASWPIPNQPGGHLEFFLENLLQKPVIAQEGSRE